MTASHGEVLHRLGAKLDTLDLDPDETAALHTLLAAAADTEVSGYTATTFTGLLTTTTFPTLQPTRPTSGFASYGAGTSST